MDGLKRLKVEQLECIHGSNLLLYSRERSGHLLGRKLKAEFNRVFISSEIKDCQKILSKYNNESMDAKNAIDIVLIDFDPSAIRVIDFVNRRPQASETSNCPIIPVVVLLNDEMTVSDAAEHLRGVGGAQKIIPQQETEKAAQAVLLTMMEVLHLHKHVEVTYRDLKQTKVAMAKFPYLPVFDSKTMSRLRDLHNATITSPTNMSIKDPKDMNSTEGSFRSEQTSLTGLDHEVEEIEDAASDTEDMLPEYLHEYRRSKSENAAKFAFLSPTRRSSTQDLKTGGKSPRKDQGGRRNSKITSNNSDIKANRPSFTLPQSDQPITKPGTSLEARLDSRTFTEELLGEPQPHRTPLDIHNTKLPPIDRFLDNTQRPFWSGDPDYLHDKNKRLDMEHDLAIAVHRPRPVLTEASTVGGLNKKIVDSLWRQARSEFVVEDSKPTSRVPTPAGLNPTSAGGTTSTVLARSRSTSPSAGNHENGLSGVDHISFHHPTINTDHDHHDHNAHDHTHNTAHTNTAHKANNHNNNHHGSMTSVLSMNASLNQKDFKSMQRAERKISTIAKDTAPDFQVSNILPLDLTQRRINLGEKAMLEKGLALEHDGDYESATICYVRAGAHSKDQQISKILLGNMHYHANHMMNALRFYNMAIDILESRTTMLRSKSDEFLAFYNRAIINFRLGADTQGKLDMERAVILNPTHLQARELLSLAKRRMGDYVEAMEDALQSKIQRLEQERNRQEALEARRFVKKQRMAELKRGDSKDIPTQELPHFLSSKMNTNKMLSTAHLSSSIAHLNTDGKNADTNNLNLKSNQVAKGFTLEVPEPSVQSGIRDRVAMGRAMMAGELDDLTSANAEGGYLRLFKFAQGMKQDFFEEIFLKPSDLQAALLIEPELRPAKELQIISSTLNLFPFLRNLSKSAILELAAVVEYRVLSTKDVLFKQGEESHAACLLLHGQVSTCMELGASLGLNEITLGELPEFSVFGHMDLLFREPRPQLIKALEDVLVLQPTHVMQRLKGHHDSSVLFMPGASSTSHDMNTAPQLQHPRHSMVSNVHHSKGFDEESSVAASLDESSHHSPRHTKSNVNAHHNNTDEKDHEAYVKELSDFQALWQPILDHNLKGASRAIQSGIFLTYTMQSACEFLMVREKDFNRILWDHALEAVQVRIQTIKACGVFKNWKYDDMIRLARMAQILTVRRGETILTQGAKPEYLYIILKGMCRVVKRPNRTEMLIQKLIVAKEKADRYDRKYVFHHDVHGHHHNHNHQSSSSNYHHAPSSAGGGGGGGGGGGTGSKPSSSSSNNGGGSRGKRRSSQRFRGFANVQEMKAFPTIQTLPPSKVTVHEAERVELEREIHKLEALIQKARDQDASDERDLEIATAAEAATPKHSRPSSPNKNASSSSPSKQHSASAASLATSAALTEAENDAQLASELNRKHAEIAILQWPMIFGEACVLDPDTGISRGSIITDTACDLLAIHKVQLQTFPVDDGFMDRVKGKAVVYPADPDIVVSLFRKQTWQQYREEVMQDISTERWPQRLDALESFVVS